MFCQKCGAKIPTPEEAVFCHKCGQKLVKDSDPTVEREINTGGGAVTEGNVNAGRDFVGRDLLSSFLSKIEKTGCVNVTIVIGTSSLLIVILLSVAEMYSDSGGTIITTSNPTPTPTITPIPTFTPLPTATLSPTVTPCVVSPPDGWELYTVQAGDTLSGIAIAAAISVNEITSANCLSDALLIQGQSIYAPPITATPPNAPVSTIGIPTDINSSLFFVEP